MAAEGANTSNPVVKRGHYPGLDSLRGVAALAVVLHHAAAFFVGAYPERRNSLTQLLEPAGHPAVVIFFCLSGFVLMLSYLRRPSFEFSTFFFQRVMRIYPAFLAAFACAVLMYVLTAPKPNLTMGAYWNKLAGVELAPSELLKASTLLLHSDGFVVLPVAWSLVHEMSFSLLFPILALACARVPRTFLAVTFAGLIIGWGILRQFHHYQQLLLGDSEAETLLITAFYLPVFGLGMMLALLIKDRDLPNPKGFPELVIIAGSVFLFYKNFDAGSAIAAAALIAVLCSPAYLARLFTTKPLRHLGDISYSLYLVHFPILFYVARAATPHGPEALAGAMVLSVPACLAAGWLMSTLVEYPCQRLGKRILDARASRRDGRS